MCGESAQFAKTGNIDAFKMGREHLHDANFSVGSSHHQKHDTSSNMEEPHRFDANVAQVRFSDGGCKDCGRNIIHRDGICDMAYVTRDSMYSNQANLASQDRHRYIRDHRKEEDRDCAYMFNYQLQISDHHIDDIMMGSDEDIMPDLVAADSDNEINAVAAGPVDIAEPVVHTPV